MTTTQLMPWGSAGLTDVRMSTARAADGPAPTLVVDFTDTPPWLTRDELRHQLLDVRREGMRRYPGTGAKTIAILPFEPGPLRLLFLQGVGDTVDTTVDVCVNSGSAALAVARHLWDLVPRGPIQVAMGDAVFTYQEDA
ncbi:MAG: hypothetical protein KAG80_06220 [Nocardioides sp.]|nr:hypothetical protein [Nocardioides sp.]